MKRLIMALVAALALAVPAAAQVRDSIFIVIKDPPIARVDITSLGIDTLAVYDSVQMQAVALDAQGNPVNSILTWESSDTTAIRINPTTGLLVVVGNPAQLPGVYIKVGAQPYDQSVMGWYDTTSWPADADRTWLVAQGVPLGPANIVMDVVRQPETIAYQQTLQLCRYVLWKGSVVAMNPPCPLVFAPAPVDHQVMNELHPPLYRNFGELELALGNATAG